MIQTDFFLKHGSLLGFQVSGHSDLAEAGTDILCAAVSSAAYMAVNTVTEVLHIEAEVHAEDGFMFLKIPESSVASCAAILKGFRLHMAALQEQYPKNIHLIDTEV